MFMCTKMNINYVYVHKLGLCAHKLCLCAHKLCLCNINIVYVIFVQTAFHWSFWTTFLQRALKGRFKERD